MKNVKYRAKQCQISREFTGRIVGPVCRDVPRSRNRIVQLSFCKSFLLTMNMTFPFQTHSISQYPTPNNIQLYRLFTTPDLMTDRNLFWIQMLNLLVDDIKEIILHAISNSNQTMQQRCSPASRHFAN